LWTQALVLVTLGTVAAVDGCRPKGNGNAAADSEPSIHADSDARSTPSASASVVVTAPDAACAVAFAQYPAGGGPSPGDDLSTIAPPLRVPEGASLTIAVRASGHQVHIKGPAAVRPCTREERDVILVASGEVSVESSTPVRPGSELFLATPSFVAVVSRATLKLRASAAMTSWDLDDGDVAITNLDQPKSVTGKDKGSLKRFEDGGILLTRCGVQASSAASAERLLLGFSQGDAAAPLPSASIGILTAQQIKHARERILDCAFAEAYALSCDLLAGESDAAVPGCGAGGYTRVREHIAKAVSAGPIPSGSPPPKASASASSSAPMPSAAAPGSAAP
jgi:hypothetical protein